MAIRAALLDLDGTLVDSNAQHARAWVETFAEAGCPVPFEAVWPLIGMGGDNLVLVLQGIGPDDPRSRSLRDRRKEVFAARHLASVRAQPGARDLLQRLADEGLRRVIATSASGKDLQRLLEVADVADLVEAATSADDVDSTKPAPDVVQAALRRADCDPVEAVLIGDTPWDVAAAARAGVATIGLRCGGWCEHGLRGAAAIYDDPADLARRFDASPLAPRRRSA